MHAVEFLVVDLIGVEHCRMHQRQALATPEHRAFVRAANTAEHIQDLTTPRRRQAGYSDRERIGDKRDCCRARRGRHAMRTDPLNVRGDLGNDRILH